MKKGVLVFSLLLVLMLSMFSIAFAQDVQPLPAVEPAIFISSPQDGATVDTERGVTVTGTAQAVPENNVVVRLQDANGGILAEQPTTADANGNWSVTLMPGAINESGRIYAFSSSPADGSIVADATIFVTFSATIVPEPTAVPPEPTAIPPEPTAIPPEPTAIPSASIFITSPQNGATVNTDNDVTVFGTAENVPEGNVVVRLQDGNGGTIVEQATTADINGNWSVTFVPGALTGSGRIYAYSPSPADGSVVADATILVTYTSTPTPEPTALPPASIFITSPQNGATIVTTFGIMVTGTATSVPENNVVVQLQDANGGIIDEQATTANANGNWSVSFSPRALNTEGRIYAYAPSPADGSVITDATILVTFSATEPGPPASILITSPLNGGSVNTNNPVVVTGTAINVPENNVVVQLQDGNGGVIAEQATTADVNGNWSTSISMNPRNNTGRIYAFAPSPADGSVITDATIFVNFTSSQPQPATLQITNPLNNAVVTTTGNGFAVTGTSANLFENNVVVRVRDANGNTLRQTSTTANSLGNWTTAFNFLIQNGTRGSIYAFSTSPVDNSVVADSLINVTFSSNCTVRSDWPTYIVQPGDNLVTIANRTGSTVNELTVANCLPNPNLITVGEPLYVPRLPDEVIPPTEPPVMTITNPIAGSVLHLANTVVVSGLAENVTEGAMFVRALDNNGFVLDTQQANIISSSGNSSRWLANLSLSASEILLGTRGTLFAYAVSNVDGSVIASSAVPVIYGQPLDNPPFISIFSPTPYQQLSNQDFVTVSGRAAGLFEGNVIVRAEDSSGRILAEQPTTIDAPDAGTGGEGNWQVDLAVRPPNGTRGKIVAFSESPEDGDVIATAAVDVVFGNPRDNTSFAYFTFPLPNVVVTDDVTVLPFAGYVGGVFNDSLILQFMGDGARILYSQPLTADANGFWSAILDLSGYQIERDEQVTGRILATDPGTGRVLAGDEITGFLIGDGTGHTGALSGTVDYLENVELPEGTLVTVRLIDVSVPGAPSVELGQQVIVTQGEQVPIPFSIEYDPATIQDADTYSLQASITVDGALWFINTTPHLVLTNGNPTDNVEVIVDQVGGPNPSPGTATITGTVTYLVRSVLPAGSVVEVSLNDVSRADAPSTVLGQQTIVTQGEQVPIPYGINYDTSVIDPRNTYSMSARITIDGELAFINTTSIPVITQGNPTNNVEIVVDPV